MIDEVKIKTTIEVRQSKIDISKVLTLEDVRDVLRVLDISVWDDYSERFAPVRRFLVPAKSGDAK